jgi:hypothetical protein
VRFVGNLGARALHVVTTFWSVYSVASQENA